MKRFLPLIFIASLFAVFRVVSIVVDGFPINSAPLSALFLCGLWFAGARGLMLTGVLWLVAYPLLSVLHGYAVGADFIASVVGLASVTGIAYFMMQRFSKGFWQAMVGGLLGALAFYLITNTFSWIANPLYTKDLSGFYQAQWSGHPTYSLPTWVFLRNSLAGNALFIACYWLGQVSFLRKEGLREASVA